MKLHYNVLIKFDFLIILGIYETVTFNTYWIY